MVRAGDERVELDRHGSDDGLVARVPPSVAFRDWSPAIAAGRGPYLAYAAGFADVDPASSLGRDGDGSVAST